MNTEPTLADAPLSDQLGVSATLQRMPRGEVMATGVISGVRVELVRYTEQDIKTRDSQWQHELERERTIARQARCRELNLELDLRRVLDGEATLCDFAVVNEVRARLTPDGLGAGAEARCCPQCDDGDGNCVYPAYGVAPHIHDAGPMIGSTVIVSRDQWPTNFEEDSDLEYSGCGTYTHCLHCGAPNVKIEAPLTAPRR